MSEDRSRGKCFLERVESISTGRVELPYYELKPLELGKRTNSYIRVNTRELNRELYTK